MKTVTRALIWLPGLLLLALLAGCGTAPGTASGSGFGADGGPWPTAPTNRNAAGQPLPDAEKAPVVPVTITLRGKGVGEQELRLDITSIRIRYGEKNWLPIAAREDIIKQEAMPVRFGAKGNTVFLGTVKIPRRKYSYLEVNLTENKCLLVKEDVSTVLALKNVASMKLNDWTPDEKGPNVLALTIDNSKITLTPATAIAGEFFTVKPGVPAGAITGKITPAIPTTRVEAFWAGSKSSFGFGMVSGQDGAFTIPNLPAGSYRLEITAAGYHLAEPFKETVAVEDKAVTLKPWTLEKDDKATPDVAPDKLPAVPEKAPEKAPELKNT
jgi:hypothetical protein